MVVIGIRPNRALLPFCAQIAPAVDRRPMHLNSIANRYREACCIGAVAVSVLNTTAGCQKPREHFSDADGIHADRPETSQDDSIGFRCCITSRKRLFLYTKLSIACWNSLKTACANRADQREQIVLRRCSASGIVAHLSHRSKRVANHKGAGILAASDLKDAGSISTASTARLPLRNAPATSFPVPERHQYMWLRHGQNEKADCKDFHRQDLNNRLGCRARNQAGKIHYGWYPV